MEEYSSQRKELERKPLLLEARRPKCWGLGRRTWKQLPYWLPYKSKSCLIVHGYVSSHTCSKPLLLLQVWSTDQQAASQSCSSFLEMKTQGTHHNPTESEPWWAISPGDYESYVRSHAQKYSSFINIWAFLTSYALPNSLIWLRQSQFACLKSPFHQGFYGPRAVESATWWWPRKIYISRTRITYKIQIFYYIWIKWPRKYMLGISKRSFGLHIKTKFFIAFWKIHCLPILVIMNVFVWFTDPINSEWLTPITFLQCQGGRIRTHNHLDSLTTRNPPHSLTEPSDASRRDIYIFSEVLSHTLN